MPRRTSVRLVLAGALAAGTVFALTAHSASAVPAAVPINSASCPANMASGEVDGCVVWLQRLLNADGAGLGVDGDFGPATSAAVRAYQSAHNLAIDGVVGVATKASLLNSGTGSLLTCGQLRQGAAGLCVRSLQTLLNTYGAALAVDGLFGPNTDTAVRHFQSSHGLSPDGIVGPLTTAALETNQYGSTASVDLRTSCPTLARGATGNCVRSLQTLLNQHGASLTVDGDFGPLTDSAVRAFQTAHALAVDGQLGPNTKNALYATGSGTGGPTGPGPIDLRTNCPNLQQDATGSCVSVLQTLLNGKGYHLAVDGDFGPATDSAVRDFQARAGLQVDGVVGPNTKKALYGSTPPPLPTGNGSRDTIARIALAHLGGHCSDFFGCPDPGEWCSDFSRWVWGHAGVDSSGLDAGAVSFYWWGARHHSIENTGIYRVGDAIVWSDDGPGGSARHVALIEAIDASGRITELGGNQGGGDGIVDEWPPMYGSQLASYYGAPVLAVISPIADGQTHG